MLYLAVPFLSDFFLYTIYLRRIILDEDILFGEKIEGISVISLFIQLLFSMNELRDSDKNATLECDVVISDINPASRLVLKFQFIKDTTVTLGRNNFKDLTVQISNKKSIPIKFVVHKNYKVYKKFASTGKASIDVTPTKQVMISNCAPQNLSIFLNLLDTKFKKTAVKGFVSTAGERLRNGLSGSGFDDISPLTAGETRVFGKSGRENQQPSYTGATPIRPAAPLKRKSGGIDADCDDISVCSDTASVCSVDPFRGPSVLNTEQQLVVTCVLRGKIIPFC